MAEPVSVFTLVSAFGSLASMLNAYINARRQSQTYGPEQARQILLAQKTGREDASEAGKTAAINIIISQRTLDRTLDNIVRSDERFGEAVGDIRLTPQQRDQEFQIAKAEICSQLQLINQ